MATEVKVPTLGESITEATLGEWLKQPGDPVQADEPIASLETDKVSVEVPSPVAGVMGEQKVAVGDTVEVGALLATVEEGGAAAAKPAPAPSPSPAPAAAPEPKPTTEDKAPPAAGQQAPAGNVEAAALSPSVRRAVLEYGVDPATITGTGKDGRITKDDVIAAAQKGGASAQAAAPAAAPSAAPARKEERVRMTRLRQTIAKRLKEAQ